MAIGETYAEDRLAFIEHTSKLLSGIKPYEGVYLDDLKKEEKSITKILARKHYKVHGACIQTASVVKHYADKSGFYLHVVCLFEDSFIDTMNSCC